jgi:hypothetical protein
VEYIVIKRFQTQAICGAVNIPAMTICFENNGFITYNGKPLCSDISENAHKFFSKNDDGEGLRRGSLVQKILKKLSQKTKNSDRFWDKIWSDKLCSKYKRVEHQDRWIWNHDFYNAPIYDLVYIAQLLDLQTS